MVVIDNGNYTNATVKNDNSVIAIIIKEDNNSAFIAIIINVDNNNAFIHIINIEKEY